MNNSGGEGEEHIGRYALHVERGEGQDGVHLDAFLIYLSKSFFCQIFVLRTINLVQGGGLYSCEGLIQKKQNQP